MALHPEKFFMGDRSGGDTLLSGSGRVAGGGIGNAGTSPFERASLDAAAAGTQSFPPSGLSSIANISNPLAGLDTASLMENFPSVEAVAANFNLIPPPTQSVVSGGGVAPNAGTTLFTANEALGPASETGATFFGTPIFPPNGGFAPPDFFSPDTLLAFAEAGRKRSAMEAARNAPVAPVASIAPIVPVGPVAPGAAAIPGGPVPVAQAASAAQQAIAQQSNALVAALAQQIIARNKAAKTSSLPPLPPTKTPEKAKVAAIGSIGETPALNGRVAALGELIPTADGAFLTPIGARSWKLPNSGSRKLKTDNAVGRMLRNINSEFEKTPGRIGRILSQAGKGFGEAFDGKKGIGPETWQALVKAGIFRSNNTDIMSGVQSFNEIVIGGGGVAVDLVLRTLQAVENFGIEGIVQFAREAGESETGARRLKRDLLGLATMAGILSGRNAGAFRRGGPGRRSVKPRESRARRQLVEGLFADLEKIPNISAQELFGEFRRRITREIEKLKSTGRMSQTEVRRWEELRARLDAIDGAFGEAKGEIVEEVLFNLLERTGVKATKPKPGGKSDIQVFDSKGNKIANFDQVIEGTIETVTGFFVVRRNTKGAAIIEAKAGRTNPTRAQSRAATAFEEGEVLTVRLRDSHGNMREVPVKTIDWFRLSLDRAPRKMITRVVRRKLQKKMYEGNRVFSDAEIDELLRNVNAWHRQAIARRHAGKAVGGVLTLGGLALVLGLLTETKVQAEIRRQRTPSAPIK